MYLEGRQGQGGSIPPYQMEDKPHKTNGNGQRLVESGRFSSVVERIAAEGPEKHVAKTVAKKEWKVMAENWQVKENLLKAPGPLCCVDSSVCKIASPRGQQRKGDR